MPARAATTGSVTSEILPCWELFIYILMVNRATTTLSDAESGSAPSK